MYIQNERPDFVITGSVTVATPFVSVAVDKEIGDLIAASNSTREFATGLSKASISRTLTLEVVPATTAPSAPSTVPNRCAGLRRCRSAPSSSASRSLSI